MSAYVDTFGSFSSEGEDDVVADADVFGDADCCGEPMDSVQDEDVDKVLAESIDIAESDDEAAPLSTLAVSSSTGSTLPGTNVKRAPTTSSRREKEPAAPIVDFAMCVRGGQIGRPHVVWPLWSAGGKKWIQVTEHLSWLRKATSPSGSTVYSDRFAAAIAAMRDELKSAVTRRRSGADSDQAKLRASMGLADDEGCKPKTKSKKKVPIAFEDLVVAVPLGKQVVNVRNELRPLLIEASVEGASAMLEFVAAHLALEDVTSRKRSRAEVAGKESFTMKHDQCVRIDGKIGWHPSASPSGAWSVTYKDKQKTARRHLVKVSDYMAASGQSPSSQGASTLADARRRAWTEAVRFWDAEDCRTRWCMRDV